MKSNSAAGSLLPSPKVMVRGIQGFLVFSLLGTLLGVWWKRPAGLEDFFRDLDGRFILILIPLIVLDSVVGGLRYRLYFDGKILPEVSLWNCMRSNWANMFMGAATPFQSGGGPAQLYILWRCGATVADGILSSLINYAATLIFFLMASVAALLLLPPDLFGENFAPLFKTGFIAIGGVAGLVLLTLIYPKLGMKVITKLFGLVPIRSPKFSARRNRLLHKLEVETQRFSEGFQKITRQKKWALAVTVLATLTLFSNKYLIGYVIARSLGQDVPFGIFLGLQIVQLLLIYFAPTPGASGVAELSSVWLMGKLLPEPLLLIYAVLWRFATTIIGAAIGGLVLIFDVRHWATNTKAPLPFNMAEQPIPIDEQRSI
ncbi:MAG: flippase-like domain-containing protein [candidate division KSB1 bacterium]|nr:flippase-like domain-containing protein [candidate division KSB1 bacterium]MDZ7366615.1 flippase-like domain-containing protein [candidate division KSB1 bacterium]MDZ7404626.1 flippase-like domain-containing protein [candidate division KSB1 bacterium]